jgi:hypothetical protein
MATWKRNTRKAIKVVTGVAVFAFVFANPFTNSTAHIVAFFASIPVLLICFVFWQLLSDGDPEE